MFGKLGTLFKRKLNTRIKIIDPRNPTQLSIQAGTLEKYTDCLRLYPESKNASPLLLNLQLLSDFLTTLHTDYIFLHAYPVYPEGSYAEEQFGKPNLAHTEISGKPWSRYDNYWEYNKENIKKLVDTYSDSSTNEIWFFVGIGRDQKEKMASLIRDKNLIGEVFRGNAREFHYFLFYDSIDSNWSIVVKRRDLFDKTIELVENFNRQQP